MKIYLAIPYSFNPELSYSVANEVAAHLMNEGHVVFSPISHSHPVADHLDPTLRTDHEFWMKQDLPFVEWAEEVYVVVIGKDGIYWIQTSPGVQREMEFAKALNKPIKHIQWR